MNINVVLDRMDGISGKSILNNITEIQHTGMTIRSFVIIAGKQTITVIPTDDYIVNTTSLFIMMKDKVIYDNVYALDNFLGGDLQSIKINYEAFN